MVSSCFFLLAQEIQGFAQKGKENKRKFKGPQPIDTIAKILKSFNSFDTLVNSPAHYIPILSRIIKRIRRTFLARHFVIRNTDIFQKISCH